MQTKTAQIAGARLRATASRAGSMLARNPSLFCRVALAKLNTTRGLPRLPVQKRIGEVRFELDDAQYRGTAPMYFGSYAMPLVAAMKRYLRPGSVFVDVGANIGYISAIAADIVGRDGEVHCFEPVPRYFDKLERFARMNTEYRISVNACAAGESEGTSTVYITHEAGQNTLVPAYKTSSEVASTLTIPVVRLDEYLLGCNLHNVAFVKIDAEGFELPILRGLEQYFERATVAPAIACEIAPKAYPLMGRKVEELCALMRRHGYAAFDMVDGTTPVNLSRITQVEDVLFLASGGE